MTEATVSMPVRMSDRPDNRRDEFDDLVALLMDYRIDDSKSGRELTVFIANACMGDNHLWQDMNLPSRTALSELMKNRFPGLVAENTGDMKWKKFLYKKLCGRAEIYICKAPTCKVCVDYDKCFGAED